MVSALRGAKVPLKPELPFAGSPLSPDTPNEILVWQTLGTEIFPFSRGRKLALGAPPFLERTVLPSLAA